MARQRSHSIEFKRQVAQEFIAGESLYALSKRHDISRQLVRVWVQKYEAGMPKNWLPSFRTRQPSPSNLLVRLEISSTRAGNPAVRSSSG